MTTTLDKNPLYMTGTDAERLATLPTKVRMGTFFGTTDTKQLWNVQPNGLGVHVWVNAGVPGGAGPAGSAGTPGTGYISYASFYALQPVVLPDNGPIAQATFDPILFPNNGPASVGANAIVRGALPPTGSFVLPSAGIYEVSFQTSITQAAQLALGVQVGGVGPLTPLLPTLTGRDTGTCHISNTVMITGGALDVITLRNFTSAGASITLESPGGSGAGALSSWISIKKIT